jgi:hypothetical protein
MAKWHVTLERTIVEQAMVKIEAEDESEARYIACDKATTESIKFKHYRTGETKAIEVDAAPLMAGGHAVITEYHAACAPRSETVRKFEVYVGPACSDDIDMRNARQMHIRYLAPRKRNWDHAINLLSGTAVGFRGSPICYDNNKHYVLIEHEGRVLFDSRTVFPCMKEFTKHRRRQRCENHGDDRETVCRRRKACELQRRRAPAIASPARQNSDHQESNTWRMSSKSLAMPTARLATWPASISKRSIPMHKAVAVARRGPPPAPGPCNSPTWSTPSRHTCNDPPRTRCGRTATPIEPLTAYNVTFE